MLRRVLIVIAALAVASASYLAVRRARERRLRELFSGPCRTVVGKVGFYPRCRYDLREYEAYEEVGPIPELFLRRPRLRLKWVEDVVTRASMPVEDRLRWRSVYRDRAFSKVLRVTYPQEGALFPLNFCEPSVEWEDEVNEVWQVEVGVRGTSERWSFFTQKKMWWFPKKLWRKLKERPGRVLWLRVKGTRKGGEVHASPEVFFEISPDSVDDYVIYRFVAPQFQTLETPDMYIREISSFETRPFLLARGKYCFSCHTFSSKDGTSGMMSIKVYFMVTGGAPLSSLGVLELSSGRAYKVKVPYPKGFTYMAWDPEGGKLAIAVRESFISSTPIIHETQELRFDSSDIAVYEPSKGTFHLLPGADSPEYVENFPAWSPDGRKLLFSRTRPRVSARLVRYDVYALDYNDGKGGAPVPVPGASHNGRSNYFARYSPDGRWISFCMADQGSLIESSSDIYLMPGDLKGPPHRLESNADYAADSWHSWSSNSKWLVFASKREDGIYARLYFTHIDEEGRASPPVRLPVKGEITKSFNIPELLSDASRLKERKLFDAFKLEAPAVSVKGE